MGSRVSSLSAVPVEVLRMIMEWLPAPDLLVIAAVCRLWRQAAEDISEEKYRREYGLEFSIPSLRVSTTWRMRYLFTQTLCRQRKQCWGKKENHPLTLFATKSFLRPGKTDIVMDALIAPVEFHEIGFQTYLVKCGVKVRLVTLPVITSCDPLKRYMANLRELPEELGRICHLTRGNQYVFALAGNDSKLLHVLSSEVALIKILSCLDNGTSLAAGNGLLVAGTEEGNLIGWKESEIREKTVSGFSCQIGKRPLSWLAVASQGKTICAVQDQELVVVRNLFATPRIKRFPLALAEGCKPFLHGPFLLWRSPRGFTGIDLNNDKLYSFPAWTYVHPVAGRQLLVQEENGSLSLLDEQMQRTRTTSLLGIVQAADFRDDFLLIAYDASKIFLYRWDSEDPQEIYRNCVQTVEEEKIVQISINIAGTIAYSTNNGRFIYGCPIFEGLPLNKTEASRVAFSWCSLV